MSSILLKINYDNKKNLSDEILKNILKEIKKTIKYDLKKNENVFFNYNIEKN